MKSFITLLIIALLLGFSSPASAHSLELKGARLYFRHIGKPVLVKELQAPSDFYGYDLMDDQHIFLAYQDQSTAEAIAILAIYDLNTRKEQKLTELGGAGESHFTYSRENHLVLFNLDDGIQILKIDPASGIIGKPRLVQKQPGGKFFFKPQWIDAQSFQCEEMDDKTGKRVMRKFSLAE